MSDVQDPWPDAERPGGTDILTEERVQPVSTDEGDHERFSHFVQKNKIVESAVTGHPGHCAVRQGVDSLARPAEVPGVPRVQGDLGVVASRWRRQQRRVTSGPDQGRPADAPARPERIFGRKYRTLTFGVVAIITVIAFEFMGVVTAMPIAARDLGGLEWYAWAFTAFSVTSLYSMVVGGEWADRFGPVRPIIVGASLFGLGLLIAGTAEGMPQFLLGRAVQGLGSGGTLVAMYVVIGKGYPEEIRPRVFTALSGAWVVPGILGPVDRRLDHRQHRLALGLPRRSSSDGADRCRARSAAAAPAPSRRPHAHSDPWSKAAGPAGGTGDRPAAAGRAAARPLEPAGARDCDRPARGQRAEAAAGGDGTAGARSSHGRRGAWAVLRRVQRRRGLRPADARDPAGPEHVARRWQRSPALRWGGSSGRGCRPGRRRPSRGSG